ncbi:MAG TPA: hypothetical protein VGX92_17515 [Pyrinomonadaceae bacterium]|jgi:hypothetical protein|nr:hypothetical protein [Pyrinomonadaceae bacterium]
MPRSSLKWFRYLVGLLSALFFQAQAARAQEVQVEVAQPSIHFLSTATGQEDKNIEPSAVEPIGDGTLLLVADDENKNLLVVEAATGAIKQELKLGKFDKKPKWEAMARDPEGNYYVIGSHSIKREDAAEPDAAQKLKDRSRLFRFRLSGGTDGKPLAIDDATVVEWNVTDALAAEGYSSDPARNSVKVEGLAIRTLTGCAAKDSTVRELVIGLRQPDEPLRVYAADISQPPATNAKLALRPLFRFDAGRRGNVHSQLSSIEYAPAFKGFLILTSTEDADNSFHGNTLWFLADEKISAALPSGSQPEKLKLDQLQPVAPQKVWLFGVNSKAEGLCLISEATVSTKASQMSQAHLALVYDNDTETTQISGALQLITVVLWPK